MKPPLTVVPLTLRQADAFVTENHRHHGTSRGCKFALGICNGSLRGVAVAGRPVARLLDDGATLEITRLATDGTPNACSKLYRAVSKVARAMGYRRVITYTLASEPGASLRGAGFKQTERVRGRSWTCPSRPRQDDHPLEDKLRWELSL
jgi:hypothetical protein